jgi:tetratricopeptide (TPR) repeat protein
MRRCERWGVEGCAIDCSRRILTQGTPRNPLLEKRRTALTQKSTLSYRRAGFGHARHHLSGSSTVFRHLRHKGRLLLRQGYCEAAEELYRKALRIAEEQEAKLWELRAAVSLARLRRDQGRHAEARDLLAPIYGWFTEGFDTADLKEAKALLDELT